MSPARTDQYRLVVPLYGQLVTVPLGLRWPKLTSVWDRPASYLADGGPEPAGC